MPNKVTRKCILFGGGVESSYIAAKKAGMKYDLVFIDYGQLARKQEYKSYKEIKRKFKYRGVICVSPLIRYCNHNNACLLLNGIGHPFVISRNLMLCIEAARLGYSEILIGSHSKDKVPDKTDVFYKNLSVVLSASFGRRVCIKRHTASYSTMVKTIKKHGLVPWSCWVPRSDGTSCLKCAHCKKLIRLGLM